MITIAIVIGDCISRHRDQRQILYACMHISCVWWLLEQRIYPDEERFYFRKRSGLLA